MPSRRPPESTPPKTPSATPAPKKRAAPKARPVEVTPRAIVTEEMRRGMIAESAYLRAERRGFAPGKEDEDWLAAEAEVDRLLALDSARAQ
jgi:DUF2934 family protein